MGFFKDIFYSSDIEKRLTGDWFSDLNNDETAKEIGDVRLCFSRKKPVYEIRLPDKAQIINMTFEIKNTKIITDQPSYPQKEETDFYFDEAGGLILRFNGLESRFIKKRL